MGRPPSRNDCDAFRKACKAHHWEHANFLSCTLLVGDMKNKIHQTADKHGMLWPSDIIVQCTQRRVLNVFHWVLGYVVAGTCKEYHIPDNSSVVLAEAPLTRLSDLSIGPGKACINSRKSGKSRVQVCTALLGLYLGTEAKVP